MNRIHFAGQCQRWLSLFVTTVLVSEVKNFPRPIPASGANFNMTRGADFW